MQLHVAVFLKHIHYTERQEVFISRKSEAGNLFPIKFLRRISSLLKNKEIVINFNIISCAHYCINHYKNKWNYYAH